MRGGGCTRALFTMVLFLGILHIQGLQVAAREEVRWLAWVKDLRCEALAEGVTPALFDDLFDGLAPNREIREYERNQPERRLSFLEYRESRVDTIRIRMGREALARHGELLEKIGDRFHVDPCVITALWGLETSYGRVTGGFFVIEALASLAFESTRRDYFRRELIIALKILDDGHITKKRFLGEWAGASGQPQFMPSSWQRFAFDYDGDGKRDIWTSLPDALASIANFLAGHGWQEGVPWGMPVDVPREFPVGETGPDHEQPLHEWVRLGAVAPLSANSSELAFLPAALIRPDGGPAFAVFSNFRVLMKYNRSIYYAASVGYLADRLCNGDGENSDD